MSRSFKYLNFADHNIEGMDIESLKRLYNNSSHKEDLSRQISHKICSMNKSSSNKKELLELMYMAKMENYMMLSWQVAYILKNARHLPDWIFNYITEDNIELLWNRNKYIFILNENIVDIISEKDILYCTQNKLYVSLFCIIESIGDNTELQSIIDYHMPEDFDIVDIKGIPYTMHKYWNCEDFNDIYDNIDDMNVIIDGEEYFVSSIYTTIKILRMLCRFDPIKNLDIECDILSLYIFEIEEDCIYIDNIDLQILMYLYEVHGDKLKDLVNQIAYLSNKGIIKFYED